MVIPYSSIHNKSIATLKRSLSHKFITLRNGNILMYNVPIRIIILLRGQTR